MFKDFLGIIEIPVIMITLSGILAATEIYQANNKQRRHFLLDYSLKLGTLVNNRRVKCTKLFLLN